MATEGATKPRQEHQVSRCFYFENGANEHMSGVTDGWCSVLLFPASQKTVMFAVPHLREWTQRHYVYGWAIAGLFPVSDILHASFISELSVVNYGAYTRIIAGKALSVGI
jgi:hypothetical protein